MVETPKWLEQASLVDGPKSIECDVSVLSIERHRNTPWVGTSTSRHRGDIGRAERLIQLVGRNHHARTGFAYFAAAGRIERNENHVKPTSGYHSHSSSSKLVGVTCSRSSSSRCRAISSAVSAQPWLRDGAPLPRGRQRS